MWLLAAHCLDWSGGVAESVLLTVEFVHSFLAAVHSYDETLPPYPELASPECVIAVEAQVRGFWMAGQHLAVPQPYLSILGRLGSRAGLGWVVM